MQQAIGMETGPSKMMMNRMTGETGIGAKI